MDTVYLKRETQKLGLQLVVGRSKLLPLGKQQPNGKRELIDVGPEALERLLDDGFEKISKSEYDSLRSGGKAKKEAPAPVEEKAPKKKAPKKV